VPRYGKTVALSPHDCRRLLDAPQGKPELQTPVDRRDRALLAVLAYSGCRVGELVRLRVRDFKTSGEHRILTITGKGGKERTTPLHLEAVEGSQTRQGRSQETQEAALHRGNPPADDGERPDKSAPRYRRRLRRSR
jgi:integrase